MWTLGDGCVFNISPCAFFLLRWIVIVRHDLWGQQSRTLRLPNSKHFQVILNDALGQGRSYHLHKTCVSGVFSKQMAPACPNPVPSFSVSVCPHRAVFHLRCLAFVRNIMDVAPFLMPACHTCVSFWLSGGSWGAISGARWGGPVCPFLSLVCP